MTSNFSTTISQPSFDDFDDEDDAESDNEIYSEIVNVIKKTEFPITTTTHSDDICNTSPPPRETRDPVFPLWTHSLENEIISKSSQIERQSRSKERELNKTRKREQCDVRQCGACQGGAGQGGARQGGGGVKRAREDELLSNSVGALPRGALPRGAEERQGGEVLQNPKTKFGKRGRPMEREVGGKKDRRRTASISTRQWGGVIGRKRPREDEDEEEDEEEEEERGPYNYQRLKSSGKRFKNECLAIKMKPKKKNASYISELKDFESNISPVIKTIKEKDFARGLKLHVSLKASFQFER